MPITPGTLARHELVGLDAEVVSASNPDLVGTSGEVVAETTKTLRVESEGRRPSGSRTPSGGADRVVTVPKADATFAFTLGREGGPDSQVVTVAGERLVARPARRTEQTGDSKWR